MEASNPTTTETNNPVETNKSSETNKPNKRRNYRHRKPRTNKPKKEKETKEEQEEEEEEEEICFICTEPIDYYALAPCGHRTCHMCTLRLRALYRTKNCAYCKIEATKVVFTNDGEKTYESYKRDDTPFYDKKHGIRFEKKEMQLDTERILQFQCPDDQCKESFSNHIEIKKHVKESHKKQLW
ncbi:hypothetical protein G6F56_013174 [Rhizopus delemar]|nr:hypothetical protein G6F56_013174 [Rhizopus delemar]